MYRRPVVAIVVVVGWVRVCWDHADHNSDSLIVNAQLIE